MLDKRRTASPVINASLALIEVDRAITDLRRGGLVIVAEGASVWLVQAAEAITAECLARFTALSGTRPSLAITRRRAAALQLAEPPTTPGGTVLLSLPDPIEARFLRYLADPAALAPYREAGIERVLLEVPDLSRDEILRLLDQNAKLIRG